MQYELHKSLHLINQNQLSVEDAYRFKTRRQNRKRVLGPGPRFFCPICNKWYRRFIHFGLNRRPNAECPGCGALERHRFLYIYLSKITNLFRKSRRVLHISPERCIQAIISALPNIKYTGIDRYDNDANADQQDLTDLPYPNASFDLIICNHVLEHIVDDRKALSEIARVLRPSGRAIITVPIDSNLEQTYENLKVTTPSDRYREFGHPFHVRTCGLDYIHRIKDSGFCVAEFQSREITPHIRRINRIKNAILYDCVPKF